MLCLGHRYKLRSCQNVYLALSYLLDDIYIRIGKRLYRQIVGIPLVADFFFIMEEISLLLFLMIIKPILLRHLTQPLDI